MSSKGSPTSVFLYEHSTGGGLAEGLLEHALVREGDLMVRSLAWDLAEAGAAVTMTRDQRLPDPDLPARIHWVGNRSQLDWAWDQGLSKAWAVLPVAPESGKLLEKLARHILRRRCHLLGSRPESIRLAASKVATASHLASRGVAAVATRAPATIVPDEPGPWVIKPDDGVGCEGIRILPGPWRSEVIPASHSKGLAVQPLITGQPASLTLLCARGWARLISANYQWVARQGSAFRFEGGTINALFSPRLARLGEAVAAAFPGFWGWVGVDLVLTPEGPKIIEINPRPTSPYAVLRKALGLNPGVWLMELAQSGRLPSNALPAGEPTDLFLETECAG